MDAVSRRLELLKLEGLGFSQAEIVKRAHSQLGDEDKKTLLNHLSEFARQPFIKTEKVTPSLLSRVFASEATYLYWIGSSLVNAIALDSD